MSSNLAFVLEKKGVLKFEDRPFPKIESPHDVLVNVRYTGICGSDIHFWQEGGIGSYIVKDPMVLGHESAGVVVEVGDQVKSLKKGDKVAVEPGVPCRRCIRCKEGSYNLCPDMVFAATPPIDGTLQPLWKSPEDFCYKLPDSMSLQEGALMEPLAVAVHITKQSMVKPGNSIVVFGAGPVGLLCCAVAKSYGANKIVSVDMNEERLAFAKKYVGALTIAAQRESAEDAAERIIKEGDLGSGSDCVIDATGAAPCINTAQHVLRTGGTYVQGGMGAATLNNFPIMAVCAKELNVRGSFRYGAGDYEQAISLVSSGRLSVKELITGTVAFKEAEKAFESVHHGQGIKTLIEGITMDGVSAARL